MSQYVLAMLFLCILLPIGSFLIFGRNLNRAAQVKCFRKALCVNVLSFFGVLVVAVMFVFSEPVLAAQAGAEGYAQITGITDNGMRFIAAAISTGLATIGAGVATGFAASAALGALSENDAIMGRALIFVALAEGIAIYGLLISFMILN